IVVQQIGEQIFRPVEQAGLHVVLAQLHQRLGALLIVQAGASDDVLVETNGLVDLPTPAEQAAQRQVRFHRVRVDLDQLQKDFDRLVGLLVEQIVEPAKVVAGEGFRSPAIMARILSPGQVPAAGSCQREQEKQNQQFSQ